MSKQTSTADKTQNNEFLLAQYTKLIEMWEHHNTNQLLFPPVIISAVLIVLSLVLNDQPSGKIQRVLDMHVWGRVPDLQISVGIPLLITGLAIAPMIYSMGRAKRIMDQIRAEVTRLEPQIYGHEKITFSILEHPRGISATIILRFFMIFLLCLPITAFGSLMLFGLQRGTIIFGVIVALWLILEMTSMQRPSKKSVTHHPYKLRKLA